jgi:CYTH domain-containing protein
MPKEYERKFLIPQPDNLPKLSSGTEMCACYIPVELWIDICEDYAASLMKNPETRERVNKMIRVDHNLAARLRRESGRGVRATIKDGNYNEEQSVWGEIPDDVLNRLLASNEHPSIEKTRYEIPYEGEDELTWEIDYFKGANEGRVIAEIELDSMAHPITKPDWLGREVTEEKDKWSNLALAIKPRPGNGDD